MTPAAVVLAAGGSTRMGRPKPLLPFRGRSLLRHVAEVAVAAGCEPVMVVLGAAPDRHAPELADLPVTAAVNPEWERGPGTSVRAGVVALPDHAEAVVFPLTDQPFVDADHIRRLVDAHAATGRPMAASGYGGICSAVGLLSEGHATTDDEVRELMSGNLCRCGAYPNIVAAVQEVRLARGDKRRPRSTTPGPAGPRPPSARWPGRRP